VLPVPAERNGDRSARRSGIAVGTENQNGVVGECATGRCYPPGSGICGICGIWGTCGLLGGGETVTVLVLVLIDVLMLGSVVVVVVSDGVVVSVLVDAGEVVWVTVWVGATTAPDVGASVVVVVVVVCVLSDESDIRLTDNHTISATRSAISAPKPTSAAGFRYQGTGGGSGG
jgi:hypothetical protein